MTTPTHVQPQANPLPVSPKVVKPISLPTLKPLRLLKRRYRVGRKLGAGGFGSVYQAEDTLLEMPVAMKVVRQDDESVLLLQKEARLLATLKHEALTSFVDLFEERGQWYLVMEYASGTSLRTLLQTQGAMPFSQVLQVAEGVFDVLDYLFHCQPTVIHRDIKPDNILLTPTNDLYLLDLGIACYPGPNKFIAGSPGYAAPEQWSEEGITPLMDIYATGVLLRELLTGKKPSTNRFALDPQRQASFAPDSSAYASLPEAQQAFCQLLDKMTEPYPAYRPSLDFVWSALEAIEQMPSPQAA